MGTEPICDYFDHKIRMDGEDDYMEDYCTKFHVFEPDPERCKKCKENKRLDNGREEDKE